MSESESYPKAEFSQFAEAECVRIFIECSEVWIEHTTW